MKQLARDGRVGADQRMPAATEKLDSAETARATDAGAGRKSTVAKVSHTLSVALAERLEEFAFFQRISESAIIEHSLNDFFAQSEDDAALGDTLRRGGAGRRRKS